MICCVFFLSRGCFDEEISFLRKQKFEKISVFIFKECGIMLALGYLNSYHLNIHNVSSFTHIVGGLK